MDPWAVIAISGGGLGILLVGTWWLVLGRGEAHVGWRRKASLVSLVLPSVALAVLVAISTIAHFHPLDEMDDASLRGGWYAFVIALWFCAHIATGVLPFCGIMSATLGNGRPRLAGTMWSVIALALFLFSLILSVNSFH